jgi:hypothetical protein
MNGEIYQALQEIGWRFEDFDDFMFWVTQSNIIINDHFKDLVDKQYDSLTEAIGFAVDILRILMEKEGK